MRRYRKKTVIIMDEVDGCSGGEDQGGVAALIRIIKVCKMPIVAIANDGGSRKLSNLKSHCYDLRFDRPGNNEIISKMGWIAKQEAITIELQAIEKILEIANNDIR